MKTKITKTKRNYKTYLYGFFILAFVSFIGIVSLRVEIFNLEQEQEELKEGLGDFMGYMINVTNYCAELNNMTIDELLKGYLEQEADKIIQEIFP